MSFCNMKPRVKNNVLRQLAVQPYIRYAMYSGDRTNPYRIDDKRHKVFEKQLRHELRVQCMFEDVAEVYGGTEGWTKRVWPKPAPVTDFDPIDKEELLVI